MQLNKKTAIVIRIYNATMRVLPMLFWMLLMFAFDSAVVAVITLLCAVIHECGHIIAGLILCGKAKIHPVLSGFRIKFASVLSYKNEALIAAMGPLTNLLLFLALIPFFNAMNGYIMLFAILNLFTAISNLAPLAGYDGYKILFCVLSVRFGEERIINILGGVSALFSAILCFFALYLMVHANTGFWLYFIFLAALLRSLSKRSKQTF